MIRLGGQSSKGDRGTDTRTLINQSRLYYTLLIQVRLSYLSYLIWFYSYGHSNCVVMPCSTTLRYTIVYSCILRHVWRCITAATAYRGSLYYTLVLHTRLNQTICTPIQAVPHFTMYSDGHSNTMTAFSSTPHVWHSFPTVPRYPALPTAVVHAAPLHSAPSCYMMFYITSIWATSIALLHAADPC